MPVESMVLVKVCVLCGDYGVLEIGRDFSEWNEFVAFVIRPLVNPGLQAPLDVYRGCGWIDPPGCHKHQRGKQPEKPQANDEPSNEGSEEARPKRRLGLRRRQDLRSWQFSHISE
jgi:hypothetical protein